MGEGVTPLCVLPGPPPFGFLERNFPRLVLRGPGTAMRKFLLDGLYLLSDCTCYHVCEDPCIYDCLFDVHDLADSLRFLRHVSECLVGLFGIFRNVYLECFKAYRTHFTSFSADICLSITVSSWSCAIAIIRSVSRRS